MVYISEFSLTKETETSLPFLAHFYFSITTILPFWEEEKLHCKLIDLFLKGNTLFIDTASCGCLSQ
jgi:hypothetical protein